MKVPDARNLYDAFQGEIFLQVFVIKSVISDSDKTFSSVKIRNQMTDPHENEHLKSPFNIYVKGKLGLV